MKKLLSLLAGICLAAAAAGAAEGAAVEEKTLELGMSSVRFPAVCGMADAETEALVNGQIRQDLHVESYLERMTSLISDTQRKITVTWDGGILGDVFSCAMEAEGAVNPPRNTHVWTASSVDLRDGHAIEFGELFADEAGARGMIETLLLEDVAGEMSAHLGNSSLLPLPEVFRLERTGLTLLYDVKQLSTLSDKAGAVKIGWHEIREAADWSEGGIPARIGAAEMVNLDEGSAERIRAMAESGQLPDIPVKIGDSVKEWTDRTGLLTDPDEYAGGRMFAPEGAAFRGVYILSDAVDSGWDSSRVQGIRMDRGCAWGLCIGGTTAEEWRRVLGKPESTVVFDAEDAENYRTVPGERDYYTFGNYRLQLHCGGDGILAGITLAE